MVFQEQTVSFRSANNQAETDANDIVARRNDF